MSSHRPPLPSNLEADRLTPSAPNPPAAVGRFAATALLALLSLAAALLTGCTTSANKAALDTIYAGQRERIRTELTTESFIEEASRDPATRNQLINDVMLLIDVNYFEVERNLHGRKSWTDFGGSVAVLGLNAAGTATGVGEVSRTMNLLSGLIVGTKAAFDRDVMQNQTILAVVARMRSGRATARLALIRGMEKPTIAAYPLSAAIVDLSTYYNAGTFTAAMQELVATAGAQQIKAEQAAATARGLGGGVPY